MTKLLKTTLAVVALGASALAATSASAGGAYVRGFGGYYGPHFGYGFRPWGGVIVAAPYYGYYGPAYAPPPVYYPPAPVYYAPPPPPPPRYAAAPERSPEFRPQAETQSFVVYFPFDNDRLTPDAQAVIKAAAAYEAANPGAHATIVGHTDLSGSDTYNDALSARRSKAVQAALLEDGVAPGAVNMDWKGKHQPAVATADGVKEPLNRRVTIIVGQTASS